MQSVLDSKCVGDVVGLSRPLVSLSYEDSVSSALQKLDSAKVFGALVNSGPTVVGVIDMHDIVRSLTKLTRPGTKDFSAESVKNLSDEGKMFSQQVVGGVLPLESSVRVTQSANICEAIRQMVKQNARRLVVVDEHGKIVNIISQFDIVQFLYENIDVFGKLSNQSIHSLALGSSPVICTSLFKCAADAFQEMINNNVRSIGITTSDDEDELVANLSLSDLKGLKEENFQTLSKTVFEYLLETQESPRPLVSCTQSNTLYDVLSQIVNNKVHRVYVVDKQQRPISVISLVDILAFALQQL